MVALAARNLGIRGEPVTSAQFQSMGYSLLHDRGPQRTSLLARKGDLRRIDSLVPLIESCSRLVDR